MNPDIFQDLYLWIDIISVIAESSQCSKPNKCRFKCLLFEKKMGMDLSNPSFTSRIQHKVKFLAEFNRLEFRVFLLPGASYYLPITGGKIVGFISLPIVLLQWEIQIALFRFWIHRQANFLQKLCNLSQFKVSKKWFSFISIRFEQSSMIYN